MKPRQGRASSFSMKDDFYMLILMSLSLVFATRLLGRALNCYWSTARTVSRVTP